MLTRPTTSPSEARSIRLVGRDSELGRLQHLFDQTSSVGGRVVLIRGEAGAGKSSLVREFCDAHAQRATVRWGWCDDLTTARPLGPFRDIAQDEPSLTEPLDRDDRPGVWEATLAMLMHSEQPSVFVIEDTHWADDATLDAVKFLGRRITRTNTLLLLTFRDGEVDHDHRLRHVIGELPPQNIARIQVDRLPSAAVASLLEHTELVLDDVLALTDGNALFVTELVAAGTAALTLSVQDSVLARAAKLSPSARRLLDVLSVIPGETERTMVDAIASPTVDDFEECVRQGLLVVATGVWFNHELTRRAIESALSEQDRRLFNQLVLDALAGHTDWAHLVHHAVEASNRDAIIEYAPLAARAAIAIESPREAMAHFRTLEPFLDCFEGQERARLVLDWALCEESQNSGDAHGLFVRAIELHRVAGDERALAFGLASAVSSYRYADRHDDAEAVSLEAVELLAPYGPSSDLSFAFARRCWLRFMLGDDELAGIAFADQAIEIATVVSDDLRVTQALILKGSIGQSADGKGDVTLLDEALRRAQEGGHKYEEVNALFAIAGIAADVRDLDRAVDFTQRVHATAQRYELPTFEHYSAVMEAELLTWKGEWDRGENIAAEVLGAHARADIVALRILGSTRARRAHPDALGYLDRMWQLALHTNELQNIDPAAAALAEYVWLTDNADSSLLEPLRHTLSLTLGRGETWPSGAFAFWMWKLGLLAEIPGNVSHFYRQIMEGQWRVAADFWRAQGAPYEEGLALWHGDQAAQIRAVEIFETLEADALSRRIRSDLKEAGTKVPRGRARSTRSHVAGLTTRQAEVLELVAEGLTNPQIADRLFVSHRTAENHVSAILMRLGVSTREAAVETARTQGILSDSPHI